MKVLVTDGLAQDAVDALQAEHDVIVEEVSAKDLPAAVAAVNAIIVRSRTKVTREVIEAAPELKVIARAGVGVDNIDVDAATERGIPVVNAPSASTIAVAELTLAHMLALARHVPRAHETTAAGGWEKKPLKGTELHGKVLGFLGSGRIGQAVALRAHVFGMRTISYDPYLPEPIAREYAIQLVEFDTLLEESDYLSVHAALTDETRHMLGAAQLAKMKPTAYIVNCARGGIIDEAALAQALKDGVVAGAALDVYEKEPPEGSPLLTAPNVQFTPHLGASTVEAQARVGEIIAEQVLLVLAGEKATSCVNLQIYD